MLVVLNMKLEIEHQVIKLLSDYFSIGRRKIEVGSRLVEDLYVDSMSVVEVVMMLSEAFDIKLPDTSVGEWKTVADVCCSVEKCRSQTLS